MLFAMLTVKSPAGGFYKRPAEGDKVNKTVTLKKATQLSLSGALFG